MAFYRMGKKMGQGVLPGGVASTSFVEEKVGEIPPSSKAVSVVQYVDEKTAVETEDVDFNMEDGWND